MIHSLSLQFEGKKVLLNQDTMINLAVLKEITADNNAVGDRVELEVTQDVFTPTGEKVIAAGAKAFGTVSEIKPPARIGKPGEVIIKADRTKAVDGSTITLDGKQKGLGQDRSDDAITGASIMGLLTMGLGAVFLLMKGGTGKVSPGTKVEAYTAADATVEIPDNPQSVPLTPKAKI